jgi:hypothetical protein
MIMPSERPVVLTGAASGIVYIVENKAKNVWVPDLVVLPLGL